MGRGSWEGYGSQVRRKEKEEAKELKDRSWESKVWEARELGPSLSQRFNTKHWSASRSFG